ncbi:uncharacterized protein BO80DRAFT_453034 [Aspergillus ibericus CBS 121593]|uniref:Rhodopsin domain-containing protein n=1 Tax=Aspergillus ibericus CBS 121593 TaxID=1448316 RepID=A0A395H8A5_9EURO|nr:hypothetical protein BO80DRAFT_453034 [Aspergillus ibericus CBS 121593]RAL03900.1 hypothetical protein BO80DRAFT_453034 [Aspergillus ibericus CBS 121593]
MAVTYGLDTPLSRDPVIVGTVFGALATITTGLRFYALRLRRVKPGAPEYLILAALVVLREAKRAVSILGGAGRHASDIDPASVVVTLKTILPLEALYGIVMGLIKCSVMLFFTRIFGSKRPFRMCVCVVMVIVWLWAISVILETFLLCRPLAYNWDITTPNGICGNRNATYVVAGTLSLITDLMVMALPLPHIWKLQLSIPKKLALSFVFCLGLLVSVISIIRLFSLMAISFTDITHSVQMGVMWTVLEPELAIICANMPLLKVLLSRMFHKVFSTAGKKYSVSSAQAFEQLQEQEAVYPMNRFDHQPVRTKISAGSSRMALKKPDVPISITNTIDEEQHELTSHGSPNAISVVHKVDIEYGQALSR